MVEVRGVEPRSEEKTLKTSTYIACLLRFTRGNSGRQDWPRAIRSRSRLWQDFVRSPSKQEHTIPSYSTFFSIPMGENRGNGSLNLIKQPVRSCSWHLSVYRFFSVDTETTIRSSELPHPRRIQVTPRVLCCVVPLVQDDALSNIRISSSRLNSQKRLHLFAGFAWVVLAHLLHEDFERLLGCVCKPEKLQIFWIYQP